MTYCRAYKEEGVVTDGLWACEEEWVVTDGLWSCEEEGVVKGGFFGLKLIFLSLERSRKDFALIRVVFCEYSNWKVFEVFGWQDILLMCFDYFLLFYGRLLCFVRAKKAIAGTGNNCCVWDVRSHSNSNGTFRSITRRLGAYLEVFLQQLLQRRHFNVLQGMRTFFWTRFIVK